MDLERYFESLTDECETLKNRVRHFINDGHWPTDGEWKESVLRSMLRRCAPESVTVGRGFVVHQDGCSTQIDVLVYDNSMPIIYRDGDLVFITPSACRGIAEVKSSTTISEFRDAVKRLADNAEFIRAKSVDCDIFVGFFAYDVCTGRTGSCIQFLNALNTAADGQWRRLVDHAALGPNALIKFWYSDPSASIIFGGGDYLRWHLYRLNRMAPGYFIHNLVLNVSKNLSAQRERTWFPRNSKEIHIEGQLRFEEAAEQLHPINVSPPASRRRGRG